MDDGEFLKALSDAGVIQYGKFTLKTGMQSPIYITFRDVISYPAMMEKLADLASAAIIKKDEKHRGDRICGVPYGALSLATLVSAKTKMPLLICRKEGPKAYGQKRAIEGVHHAGDDCLIIDDVLTSGTSILEVATALRGAGLVVKRALVLLDRCQGGIQNLAEHGIEVAAIYGLDKMLEQSVSLGLVTSEMKAEIDTFLAENRTAQLVLPTKGEKHVAMKFDRRRDLLKSSVGKVIADIILEKRTNLCLSADVRSFEQVCKLAQELGEFICALKLHADIIEDFPRDGHTRLKVLAEKHRFVLFEDRKYCDIGNTVAHQYEPVAEWAQLVTAHGVAGPGTLKGIQQVLSKKGSGDFAKTDIEARGVLLVAEMSSADNLADKSYTEKVVALGEKFPDLVVGFVSQSALGGDPGFLYWMPGVKLEAGTDNLGQQYRTPESAVLAGADVIIVGRGIYEAKDPAETAKAYMTRGFEALMMRQDE